MEIVKTRLNKVDDYRKSVLATIAFNELLEEWDIGYNLISGATLVSEQEDGNLTPDLLLKSEEEGKKDLIGDIKKNLPNPPQSRNMSEWKSSEEAKRFAEKKIDSLTSLEKYDKEFENIEPNNVFAFYKRNCKKSVDLWYLHEKSFDSFVGITYDIRTKSGGEKAVDISEHRLEEANFENEDLEDSLRYGKTEWLFSSTPQLIGEAQTAIVEECHNAPIEHVMLVLWMNVFSEIKDGSSPQEILERMKLDEKGESYVIEASLDELKDHISSRYVSEHYYDKDDDVVEESQITRGKIKDAMQNFSDIDKTDVEIIEEGRNPVYRIVYEPITKSGDSMEQLIKSLDEEGILDRSDGTREEKDSDQKSLDAIIKKDIKSES